MLDLGKMTIIVRCTAVVHTTYVVLLFVVNHMDIVSVLAAAKFYVDEVEDDQTRRRRHQDSHTFACCSQNL